MEQTLYKYARRFGDSSLILSHRLCQMSSRAPFLEEDLALSNLALDHHGLAENWLGFAATLTADYATADDLAYRRPEGEFLNFQLCEQPNSDFAFVIARQYLLDTFFFQLYTAMSESQNDQVRGIAQKAVKEVTYHKAHSSHWMRVLAGGGEESRQKLFRALDGLWKFVQEMFDTDEDYSELVSQGVMPDMNVLKEQYMSDVRSLMGEIGWEVSEEHYNVLRGLSGYHSEQLGHMLTEIQYLPRAYPNAAW